MPAVTEVAGVPLMVGGVFGILATVIEKAESEVVVIPSLTLIVILLVVPTSVLPGVPLIAPLVVLKLAQVGKLLTLKVRVSPSASLAVGVKL